MIDRPLVILGAPRSGTTLLFRCLAVHPDLWHLTAESHGILEGPLEPGVHRVHSSASNRATAADCSEETAGHLRRSFYRSAINLNRVLSDPGALLGTSSLPGRAATRGALLLLGPLSRVGKPDRIRFLEKTPKNTLRVPFLERLFPDARYLFLSRHPLSNIDSILAGWRAGGGLTGFLPPRFARGGYRLADELELDDYDGRYWKFALVPGWRDLAGHGVAEIAAWQYLQCNRYATKDLEAVHGERVLRIRLEEFVEDAPREVRRIARWADLSPAQPVDRFARKLPRVNPVEGDRERGPAGLRYPAEVRAAVGRWPELAELARRLGYSLPAEEGG